MKLPVKYELGLDPEKSVILNSPVAVSKVKGDVLVDKSIVPSELSKE